MKCNQILTASLFLTIITGSAYGNDKIIVSASDIEIQFVDKNCWVDIFEDSQFDVEDPHVRMLGPLQSATLANVAGRDWNNDIQSLIVGPTAMVYAYKGRDFSGPEVIFAPNQQVSNLDELDMGNDFESIKVQCGND